MKNLICISGLIIFLVQCITAQENYSQEAGKVTQYEMSMTEYAKDPDAEAVVIYNIGKYRFIRNDNKGFMLEMKFRTKIKILKQSGEKYATFEIPYYNGDADWEQIQDIKATTYNQDNDQLTKVNLAAKNIFEEKISEDMRVKKMALSDVRIGSVIELSYTIVTPYFFHMREWEFQKKIPVVDSKLEYRAIPYYAYTYILKGTNKFDIINSVVDNIDIRFGQLVYKEMIWNFGMKDLPAFRDQDFISSENDHMISLNFQLAKYYSPMGGEKNIMSTWPELCNDFIKDDRFGKYIKESEKETKKQLGKLVLTDRNDMDKAQSIVKYIKSMYNWNGYYGKYTSGKLSDFLKRKTGNTADINLYMIGMLRAYGLEVNPVVLSTRKNGAISKSHPFSQFLNYVVAEVKIDTTKYYIDATESLLDFDELPERCINVIGLVVKPKTEEWTLIGQKKPSYTEKQFRLKVLPDNNLVKANIDYISSGYDAYKYRSAYLEKEDNLSDFLKRRDNIDVGNFEISNYSELDKPFIFSFKLDYPMEENADKIFINPFSNLAISENLFKQTSRKLPIDLIYLQGGTYESEIEIPEGYAVDFLPKSIQRNTVFMSINYKAIEENGKIKVSASYSFKRNYYPADSYMPLKGTLEAFIKQVSEMIILKRIQ